jgi:hypothetical protein
MGLNTLDRTFDARLKALYVRSTEKGLWKKTYAATNHHEFWAEGVQSYFDCNDANNAEHNDIDTREKLARYDPELFKLIDEVFKKPRWRYVRYDKRHPPAVRADQPVKLTVVNETGRSVSIYWLNDDKRVFYKKLAARERYEQSTFVGHRWVAVVEGRKAPLTFAMPVQRSATWRLR